MQKILLIFGLLLISFISVNAAEKVIHSYIYHGSKVYDRDHKLIQDIPSSSGDPIGLFLVAEINGETYVSLSVGEKPAYEFKVQLSKNYNENDGSHIDVYAGAMQVEEQIVPLQVFVCFSKSVIPDVIIVDVLKSPTLIEFNRLVKAGH